MSNFLRFGLSSPNDFERLERSVAVLEAIYDIVAFRRPEIRNHQPEEFVATSFVAEFDKSGFIKKLYELK